jgi:hypothetical protein
MTTQLPADHISKFTYKVLDPFYDGLDQVVLAEARAVTNAAMMAGSVGDAIALVDKLGAPHRYCVTREAAVRAAFAIMNEIEADDDTSQRAVKRAQMKYWANVFNLFGIEPLEYYTILKKQQHHTTGRSIARELIYLWSRRPHRTDYDPESTATRLEEILDQMGWGELVTLLHRST